MNYNKSPATIKQQLDILKSRGCIIDNEEYAVKCLTNINYYRIAHYFAPFLEEKGKYFDNTRFEDIMKIYDFDRTLRRLILSFLEEIEIYLRAVISNYHAIKYGATGYLNASSFDNHHNHKAFLGSIERMIELNEKEGLVMHHNKKYGGVMPLWAIVELFSFGNIAYFYADMKQPDKKELAAAHFGMNFRVVEDRLMCLTDMRNICAHYNRLYDNTFEKPIKDGGDFDFPPDNTLKSYLRAAKSLYPDKAKWDGEFITSLEMLIRKYDMQDKMKAYGF